MSPGGPAGQERGARVAILSSGRFHVLDLARELTRLGHEVTFYSLVPPWRTRRFGLPFSSNRWLGAALGPLWLAQRALNRAGQDELARWSQRALAEGLDRAAALILERCDACIAMSGMGLHTLRRARSLGAISIVERGSMHIEAQREILSRRPGAEEPVPSWVVERELVEYAESDFISVPSRHAEASFIARGIEPRRLFRNAYGVSLTEFSPTTEPTTRRILMVGTWSWQKGADTLASAFEILRGRDGFGDVELHHVGPRGDVALPTMAGFHHHEPVPQRELQRFYAEASVLALPSRQDGFGMVLTQALACGVPIVGSTRTGGPDLAELVEASGATSGAVEVVPPEAPELLANALAAALSRRPAAGTKRTLLDPETLASLGWAAYGRRWDSFLRERIGQRR